MPGVASLGATSTATRGVKFPEPTLRVSVAAFSRGEANVAAGTPDARFRAMNWTFLSFLGEPWFVVPWYAVGVLAAGFVVYDLGHDNTPLKTAMKWAWPIIVLFFSVLGLALYFATARAPGIAKKQSPDEKKAAHDAFERAMWRRVNGAVIHCVAGDGIGIMTAMVIARATGMSFWQEFWFEYLVGFGVGWLVFQRKSMTMMTDSVPRQLAMAFRAEFFSMLTVMGGMGAVMTFVTPLVATAQPKPFTAAFWGFGMFGLLVGFVFTYPMNWLLVKIGWKHGMGTMEAAQQAEVHGAQGKALLLACGVVLGALAMFLPAWLTKLREDAPLAGATARVPATNARPGEALSRGLRASIDRALDGLERGNRTRASLALDDALRAAQTGAHSWSASFASVLDSVKSARIALQQGSARGAESSLRAASRTLRATPAGSAPPTAELARYAGARVVNEEGAFIGEVTQATNDGCELALGGWRNAWGFVDFGADERVEARAAALALGPVRTLGPTLVMLPTREGSRLSSSVTP